MRSFADKFNVLHDFQCVFFHMSTIRYFLFIFVVLFISQVETFVAYEFYVWWMGTVVCISTQFGMGSIVYAKFLLFMLCEENEYR